MKKNSTFTRLKPLFITSLFAMFGSYSQIASASLSSSPATPNQIRIVAKAATVEQIEAQISYKQGIKARVSHREELSTEGGNATQKVNRIYRKWAGTRYRLGGEGRGGIDCSAFVQKTMSGAFNIDLPRSTAGQRHSGRSISKSELRPGDLVFFRRNNHVGVYIGGGKFVHASSSQGVTTSSLSESYWARNYTQSRRVL
ncbi:NlpC/P60 family protein [Actinobacillus genomosp. 2]|uniref:NlpC/P60 family protein n=1 Tax=Actinobacillus genomosp. 2 TaxID=230709 RepID=UPI002441B8E8|nr:NlpC/P60 family protein [Actinobacillus genomosp. 2]WGE32691.1 NlpC/P60 family protein [Actinobacillus genomosp. 2]